MTDPTQRFSSRVDNYIRYRPRYSEGVATCLRTHCGLTRDSVMADIGSGTGMLSELFLRNGNTVFGVEPNPEMREAGERLRGCSAGWHHGHRFSVALWRPVLYFGKGPNRAHLRRRRNVDVRRAGLARPGTGRG